MSYEIVISATNFTVSSSSTQLAVTVNSPATPIFTITNAVSSLSYTKLVNTTSIYTDAVELVLGDLNTFWKGQWTTGTYYRGDIVEYQYSQYFLDDWNPDITIPYSSNTAPPNDATWIRFNWHEAPFTNLTVTNSLTVGNGVGSGGLTINNTATFNGNVFFNNNTVSFNTLTVTKSFIYNGLTYPYDRGLFGQVLFTNGVDKADWVNLGDLVYWSLTSDLRTNGFKIATYAQDQDLVIGANDINIPVLSQIRFRGNAIGGKDWNAELTAYEIIMSAAQRGINLNNSVWVYTDKTILKSPVISSGTFTADGSMTVNGAFRANGTFSATNVTSLTASGTITANGSLITNGTLTSNGTLTANTATFNGPVRVNNSLTMGPNQLIYLSSSGIRFSDGTIQTTVALTDADVDGGVGIYKTTATNKIFLNLSTATTSTLGGIRPGVGVYLKGETLNLSTATTSTLGGIIVGSGLEISTGSVLSVVTTTSVKSITSGTGIFINTSTGDVVISGYPRNIYVAGTATSVSISTGSSATITVAYWANTATSTTLGVVKPGYGLNIDSDGFLNASSTTTSGLVDLTSDMSTNGFTIQYNNTYSYTKLFLDPTQTELQHSTNTYLILGNSEVILQRDSVDSYLQLIEDTATIQARSNAYLQINSGTTTLQRSPGSSISLTTNRITVQSTANTYLQVDPTTIRLQRTSPNFVSLSANSATIQSTTTNYLQLTPNNTLLKNQNASISLTATNVTVDSATINLKSSNSATIKSTNYQIVVDNEGLKFQDLIPGHGLNRLQISTDDFIIGNAAGENSVLRVSAIYNYAGTYAPFFPAGVQYPDQTVQFTAYQPDQGLL